MFTSNWPCAIPDRKYKGVLSDTETIKINNQVLALSGQNQQTKPAENKLIIFVLFYPENMALRFMRIMPFGGNLHNMSRPIFRKTEYKQKYFHLIMSSAVNQAVHVS